MRTFKFILISSLFLYTFVPLRAQWNFNLDASTYFRDAEYLSPFCTGSTYPGFRLTPSVSYTINPHASIQGGLVLNCIAGSHGFHDWAPLLSISYRPLPWLCLKMGTYETTTHGIDEPLITQELWFTTPLEGGFSITTHLACGSRAVWMSDTWLDWEHYLEPWTPDQEIFNSGTRHNLAIDLSNSCRLDLEGAFLVRHHGGEINTIDTLVESFYHEMAGIALKHSGPHQSARISLNFYNFQAPEPPSERTTHYPNGWGLYPKASFSHMLGRIQDKPLEGQDRWTLSATLGYWIGHHWEAPLGSHLFQSVSMYRPDALGPERRLITLGLDLDAPVENRFQPRFGLGLDYDVIYHTADCLVSIMLIFGHSQPLKRRADSGSR